MREIKFRAWDKLLKSWISTDVVASFSDNNDTRILNISNRAILMQYTGLKDNNGVEIYEGDIVSIADCEPSLYKIVWWENNFKYGVEYVGTDKTNWQEEALEEFDSDLIEVIGNIYENKDLLN